MTIARNILAVAVGYLIFAVSAVLLFSLGAIDPHADASVGTIILVIVFGAVFSFIAGFTAKAVAGSQSLAVNIALAALVFAFAAFSFFASAGSHYTQIAAMFVFAPISILGGYTNRKIFSGR